MKVNHGHVVNLLYPDRRTFDRKKAAANLTKCGEPTIQHYTETHHDGTTAKILAE